MIAVETIVLTPGAEFSKVIAEQEVGLLALPNDRALPYDLVIRAFGQKQTYSGFVECTVGDRPMSFVGEVEIAFQGENRPFVAVVDSIKCSSSTSRHRVSANF